MAVGCRGSVAGAQLLSPLAASQRRKRRVVPGMISYDVAGSGKFGDQLGIPCCGLAKHEERGATAKRGEETVHEGREHRIRTVVERQRNGRRGHVEPSNHGEVAASERGHAPPEQSPASVLSTG